MAVGRAPRRTRGAPTLRKTKLWLRRKETRKKNFFSPCLSRTEESRPERPAPVAAPPARPPSVDSGRSRFCRETPPHIGNPTLPYTSSGPKRPVFIFFLENLPTDSKTVSILAYLSPRRIRSTIADLHSTDPAGAKNSGTPKNARFFRYDPVPDVGKIRRFQIRNLRTRFPLPDSLVVPDFSKGSILVRHRTAPRPPAF